MFDLSKDCPREKCTAYKDSTAYVELYGDIDEYATFFEKARDARNGFPTEREEKAKAILQQIISLEESDLWVEDCFQYITCENMNKLNDETS